MVEHKTGSAYPTNQPVREFDSSKVGTCDKGCNLPAMYFCFKSEDKEKGPCVAGVSYFCQDCLEGPDHDHRSIARDRESQRLFQEFSLVFNEVEDLHAHVINSYIPFQDIINWAQEQLEKMNNQDYEEEQAKDLKQDYQYVDQMLQHVQLKKQEVEQFTLDYKVKELLEIMKSVPSIKDFIKEMAYMKTLDINLVYDQYKKVFMSDEAFVEDFDNNMAFQNQYYQLVNRALKERVKLVEKETADFKKDVYEKLIKSHSRSSSQDSQSPSDMNNHYEQYQEEQKDTNHYSSQIQIMQDQTQVSILESEVQELEAPNKLDSTTDITSQVEQLEIPSNGLEQNQIFINASSKFYDKSLNEHLKEQ
eukprot:403351594